MPKLYASSHIAQVLQQNGFLYISQRGSHVKFQKTIHRKNITVIVLDAKRSQLARFVPLFTNQN